MANGRRLTGPEPETMVDLVGTTMGTLGVAMNDHSVVIAQAIRDATVDTNSIERGLNNVADAIRYLADAIRETSDRSVE
jgi:hypothetical protein